MSNWLVAPAWVQLGLAMVCHWILPGVLPHSGHGPRGICLRTHLRTGQRNDDQRTQIQRAFRSSAGRRLLRPFRRKPSSSGQSACRIHHKHATGEYKWAITSDRVFPCVSNCFDSLPVHFNSMYPLVYFIFCCCGCQQPQRADWLAHNSMTHIRWVIVGFTSMVPALHVWLEEGKTMLGKFQFPHIPQMPQTW